MSENNWDQSRFDATLKDYLLAHESKVWPTLINKKGYYVALAAIAETPKVAAGTIETAMDAQVTARRKDGTTGEVSRVFALAAKKASINWTSSARFQKAVTRQAFGRGGSELELKAWRAEIGARAGSIRGGRKSAAGFIRLGWVYTLKALGPSTGLSYFAGQKEAGAKPRGSTPKGYAVPARQGSLQVVIQNSAQAQSETHGGFKRLGEPALQRAMEKESQSMAEHLSQGMEPGIKEFNSRQR